MLKNKLKAHKVGCAIIKIVFLLLKLYKTECLHLLPQERMSHFRIVNFLPFETWVQEQGSNPGPDYLRATKPKGQGTAPLHLLGSSPLELRLQTILRIKIPEKTLKQQRLIEKNRFSNRGKVIPTISLVSLKPISVANQDSPSKKINCVRNAAIHHVSIWLFLGYFKDKFLSFAFALQNEADSELGNIIVWFPDSAQLTCPTNAYGE
ncbi:hypothetical protein DSO57_1030484 [Entomophthora muscae]|uniref:Uncharacterized protein n=1 Tax=Entomophthora muscae TaxID=34485 RepID=A0ACC2T1E1_9FUNG|nr:hypothetical protein DSO57_1030484 [Entomophthora muscae]